MKEYFNQVIAIYPHFLACLRFCFEKVKRLFYLKSVPEHRNVVVGVVEGKQLECGGGGGGQTIEKRWWWTENSRNAVVVVAVDGKQ